MRDVQDDEASIGQSASPQRILGESNVPVILEDDDECVLAWTRGATELFGWSADEMLGRHSPLPRSTVCSKTMAARQWARHGQIRSLTNVPVPSRHGHICLCDAVAAPSPMESGAVGVLFTLSPLTSEGVAHRLAPDFSQALLEAIPIPVFVKDAQGRYTRFNVAWEKFFDRRREQWLGRTVAEMFPGASAATYMAQDENLLRQGGMLEWEGRLPNQRGETAPVIYRKTAIKDDSGTVRGIVGAILDVTALRLAESRFREVIELAPGALIVCDTDGRIALVNAHAVKLLGYERDHLIGLPVDNLLPERYRAAHVVHRQGFSLDPSSRPMGKGRDLYVLRSDGAEIPVEIALGQLPSINGPMVIAVVADITARKHAQSQLESSLKEKTILLDEVHHRVKNNLQVISSLLSLQSSSSDDSGTRTVLSVAVARVRAIGLTYELLYERGDFASLDLAVYLARLIRLTRSGSDPADERISLTSDLSEVLVDMGQAMHCGLILNEILSNAFKHAFPGGRHGRVNVRLRHSADGWVTLIVTDDGRGFDPEDTNPRSGSLGLRLVRLLTEQLGGTLEVSRPWTAHESIRFQVRFPGRGRRNSDGKDRRVDRRG